MPRVLFSSLVKTSQAFGRLTKKEPTHEFTQNLLLCR